MNCAAIIWAPHSQKDIMKLEKVLGNAACFIIPTMPVHVSEMLRCLNWPTLAQGRNEQKLIIRGGSRIS